MDYQMELANLSGFLGDFEPIKFWRDIKWRKERKERKKERGWEGEKER